MQLTERQVELLRDPNKDQVGAYELEQMGLVEWLTEIDFDGDRSWREWERTKLGREVLKQHEEAAS